MILQTFSWKLRRAAECRSGHVGKWYNLAVFSGVIQNPHGAEVLRQAGCENFLTVVFSSPSGIKRAPGDLNCTPFVGQYGIDKQKRIDVLDARATRSKSFNADIIALHNGPVLLRGDIKNEPPPSSNGKRFGSKNGNMSFLTVSICNSRKKVKRDVVMNVEITDNSKEVSGAIHQVGQAMADTGGFLQVRKVSAARSLHGTVVIRYSRKSLRALRAFCKWESLAQPEPNSTQPAHTRSGASSARQA